jgi:small-conductance mechanosensitive channel
MPDPTQPDVESPELADIAAPAKVVEPDAALSRVQDALDAVPVAEDTLFVLELFNQMDAESPMMRLIIGVGIVAVSLLLIAVTRLIVSRRVKRLESIHDEKYQPLRWQAQDLVSREDMKLFWMRLWRWTGLILTLGFMLVGITGLLMSFSWSLRLAARLIVLFFEVLGYIWSGFVGYLPNLITIVVIVIIARYLVRLIGIVFEGIRSRRIYLKNFYPEWADTSFGIVKLMIYALTAVIIFPYLPGSSSPAFQGISIFVGVLVSLGSTTAVSNVIAGIVLTYTRAFKIGDQVEVADTRGRVVERSTFVTRIQTLKNVIVSIPNSMVLSNNIINYSKNLGQSGLLVHTGITIGYDVPWQTVNELLIAAARKTEGIADNPPPFVLQVSLEDNYVAYEVNGWTRAPEELPRIYSSLHANILDEFHGHKVEITSPQYRAVRDGNPVNLPEVLPRKNTAPEGVDKP